MDNSIGVMSRGSLAVSVLIANNTIRGYKMVYRTEHPNPQFQRESYECLNGTWEFSYGKISRKENCALDGRIEVPFCPESELSGVHNTDYINDCVYSREIEVKKADLNGRLVLHFGAVDYKAEVFINGVKVGEHSGGYTAFEIDITPYVKVGKNRITVGVHDDITENVPSGKQTNKRSGFGCFYTRVTGIWQTVWLERTPKEYIKSVKFYPDITNGSVRVELITEGKAHTEIVVYYDGREVGAASGDGYYRQCFDVELSEKHLWVIGHGEIYDVIIKFGNDEIKSYFGLRTAEYKDGKFLLNGKSVFQRLVLDQGYYGKGIYTAASADDFQRDIALANKLGFNGARLHQRVFDQRYLYDCDRTGFMVWGEYASWGLRYEDLDALGTFITEWTEAVDQNFNHPSIITWCPLNEAWNNLADNGKERDIRFVESVYRVTKTLDCTRPCVDVSGGFHGRYTDLFDFHCYDDTQTTAGYMNDLVEKGELTMSTVYGRSTKLEGSVYDGKTATHASEYGGIAFSEEQQNSVCDGHTVQEDAAWGYRACLGEQAFVEQYIQMTEQYLKNQRISGFCYTQLYDVEQEQNGLYTYDRKPKLSAEAMKRIAECNRSTAGIENNTKRKQGAVLSMCVDKEKINP